MNSLKQLYKDIKTSWGKKFRWITAFFLLWIYRTIFMPAGDGGFAQALQIISLFSMLFIVYSHWQRKVVGIFRISNPPIRTLLLLYFYALLSATWAFMPAFSAFLSIQNFILMALTFWLLSMPKTFDGVEKSLVYLIMAMAFFSAIGGRYNVGWPIFIHLLQTGTCSAMCFAYCFAEWIKEKKDKKRLRFFRTVMLISFVLLVTSTSSGANASCVAGIGTAMLFSGHAMWGALMACFGILHLSTKTNLWTYCCSSCQVKQKQLLKVPLGATDCGNRYCILQPKNPCSDGALLVPNAWYRSKAPCFHPMLITTT